MISHSELIERLLYDPKTGVFSRRTKCRGFAAESVCGHAEENGRYIRITLMGRSYYAHRLAWFYAYGEWPRLIDHVNGNKHDNRIENLRPATKSQNAANSKVRSDSVSGVRGVRFYQGKYRAVIRGENGKQVNLGRFETLADAKAAYDSAALREFGEFHRVV